MGGMQTHPTRYPTDLTDKEWDQLKSLVPAPKSGTGKRGRPVKLDRRQLVKTPDQAGERGYDAGKKVSGRKRHIAVDVLGMILAITITSAAVQDRDAAKGLITLMLSMYQRIQIIWADGGYLGKLVNWVKRLRPYGKLKLEIVRRSDDVKGFKVVRKRWIVERTFGWFYKSRRLCRDYEVRLDHSESMIRICMIRLMLKRLAA